MKSITIIIVLLAALMACLCFIFYKKPTKDSEVRDLQRRKDSLSTEVQLLQYENDLLNNQISFLETEILDIEANLKHKKNDLLGVKSREKTQLNDSKKKVFTYSYHVMDSIFMLRYPRPDTAVRN